MRNKKGFTLVELLVVMAVLSVLISIGIYAYKASLTKGRDQARRVDLALIQGALESYKANDLNGSYPNTTYKGLCPLLVPNYLSKLPWDPSSKDPCVTIAVSPKDFVYTPSCAATICTSYTLSTTLESNGKPYVINQNNELNPTPTGTAPGGGGGMGSGL